MNRQRLFILVGLGGLLALAGAGAASAATTPKQPEDGEDGGDTGGEGEGVLPPPPPPPEEPPPATPNHGPVPNSGNQAMLDDFFGDSAGIARGLYLLGFGGTAASTASAIAAGDRSNAVKDFQAAYDEFADAGRAGKSNIAFGAIPGNLGNLRKSLRKNGQYDGRVGYETMAALYNALRYFSPGPVWNLTKLKVQGDEPITQRSDMRAFLRAL